MPQGSEIPQRPLGRHSDVKIAALALGGHHIGQAQDEATAIAIMNQVSIRAADGAQPSYVR